MAGVLPSASMTLAPYDHSTDHMVVLASAQWLMAMPTGLPCFLRTVPCLRSSAQVFGVSRPAFLKWAWLYVAGKEIQNHGTERQPDLAWALSAENAYQPPYCLPSLSTTSPTSASWLS